MGIVDDALFDKSIDKSRNETIAFHFILVYSLAMTTDSPLSDASKVAASKCPAGRPRSSDREARQQELMHTAGMLFIKHGYRNVSLETIAREAHVAVRTIYVKFGGKAGLLKALVETNRENFLSPQQMLAETRSLKENVRDFALHFLAMISRPEVVAMHRMVLADAPTNPELAQTFFDAGPKQTREIVRAFFARPAIRAQLRDEIDLAILPVFLINCIIGDPYERMMFPETLHGQDEAERALDKRLDLFYQAVLK